MSFEAVPVKPNVPFCHFLGEREASTPNSHLPEIFELYKKCVALGLEAITYIVEGNLPDPNVGENACQIRAVIFANDYNSDDFSVVLHASKAVFEKNLINLKDSPSPAPKVANRLDAFLQKNDLTFTLDERVYRLVLGYLLHLHEPSLNHSFAKDLKGKVQPFGKDKETTVLTEKGFSRAAIRKLKKVAQYQLALGSVKAVQSLAQGLRQSERDRLVPMVNGNEVKITEHGYTVIPCFSTSEVLFTHACAQKTPLVVRIHQVNATTAKEEGCTTFFFKSNGDQYALVAAEDFSGNEAVIVTDAASIADPVLKKEELEQQMASRPIVDTLMAFMATHPAYGGGLKNQPGPVEESEKREALAEKAKAWGCCPENPTVCRPFHMYPAVFSKLK